MPDIQQYGNFIKEIKELIYRRQYEAMKAVNKELIQLYWEIGEEIISKKKKAGGNLSLRFYQKNFKKNFPVSKDFRRRTYGVCVIFI